MSDNENKEKFEIYPYNSSILVGDKGTIIKNNKTTETAETLEPFLSGEGYWMVKTSTNYYEYVHRLIAFTYVSGYTKERCVCHHKDNNRRNNNPKNLVWISKKEHYAYHN